MTDIASVKGGAAKPIEGVLQVATIGAGRIGANHSEILAHVVPGIRLVAICDTVKLSAVNLATTLAVPWATTSVQEILDEADVDAVVITASTRSHTDLVVAAAAAGKHIFVEKPMALTLADAQRAIDAAKQARVVLQVGFNRRFTPGFTAARRVIDDGKIGTPQLLRSVTRDPGPYTADPRRIPSWTIFLGTLIHDFDILCWLNPGAAPLSVYATADALIRPDAKGLGFLDTAVVIIRFSNGAIATAEASFSATYGYDVRAEVHGSMGMVTAGDIRATDMAYYDFDGAHRFTPRRDTELMRSAYVGELTSFVKAVREGLPAAVSGQDASNALAVALASIRSVETGSPVDVAEVFR